MQFCENIRARFFRQSRSALSYRPAFDALEARETPASVNLTGGVLTVLGTPGADNILVRPAGSNIQVLDGGTVIRQVAAGSVGKIVVDGEMGNDRLSVAGGIKKPAWLYGGKGNDFMRGGGGKDNIFGGDQNDNLNGRGGNDNIWGGAGSDALADTKGTNKLIQGSPNRTSGLSALENAVLQLVNLERTSRGLSALTAVGKLNFAAEFHSGQQAKRGVMAHELFGVVAPTPGSRLDYAGYDAWTTYGENVAFGYATAAAVMNAWMNSPGHRDNILNPNFTQIGIGIAVDGSGTLYWTQVFGDV
jgi:uncharacterized protein YkwD